MKSNGTLCSKIMVLLKDLYFYLNKFYTSCMFGWKNMVLSKTSFLNCWKWLIDDIMQKFWKFIKLFRWCFFIIIIIIVNISEEKNRIATSEGKNFFPNFIAYLKSLYLFFFLYCTEFIFSMIHNVVDIVNCVRSVLMRWRYLKMYTRF